MQSELVEAMRDGFAPTLAIVTLSNMDHVGALQDLFTSQDIALFGLTTANTFTEQGTESAEIVAMLLDIKPAQFRIVLNEYAGSTAYQAGFTTGITGKNTFTHPGFIISPIDFKMSGDEVIRGIIESAGKDATIMGGVAGNPSDFSGCLFTNTKTTEAGILALVLDLDHIELHGLAVSGWKPVGTSKK